MFICVDIRTRCTFDIVYTIPQTQNNQIDGDIPFIVLIMQLNIIPMHKTQKHRTKTHLNNSTKHLLKNQQKSIDKSLEKWTVVLSYWITWKRKGSFQKKNVDLLVLVIAKVLLKNKLKKKRLALLQTIIRSRVYMSDHWILLFYSLAFRLVGRFKRMGIVMHCW